VIRSQFSTAVSEAVLRIPRCLQCRRHPLGLLTKGAALARSPSSLEAHPKRPQLCIELCWLGPLAITKDLVDSACPVLKPGKMFRIWARDWQIQHLCSRGELSLDRLSREGVSATLGHLERLTAAGVGWRSFTEEYLDSTGLFKDAVIAILATIAKQERVRRSERASAAIARLRRQGQADKLGRRPNVFDRARAQKLRADGWSIRQIAAELEQSPMTIQRAVSAVVA
jgi:Resolvase, N terminal domain/Helix-turn-helix domain